MGPAVLATMRLRAALRTAPPRPHPGRPRVGTNRALGVTEVHLPASGTSAASWRFSDTPRGGVSSRQGTSNSLSGDSYQ